MRLDEPEQVDMVLGDGVRERGAAAHEINEDPGGPPRRTRRIRSATPPPGRHPPRPRPLPLGTTRTSRP
jgi:hypothetical protein